MHRIHTALAIVAFLITTSTQAVPVIYDDFDVVKFVDIVNAIGLAVDANDNLWAGNDPPGNGPSDPGPIRFIPKDGSSVTEVGPPIIDPDKVIVDINGHVTSPGHVIVAGLNTLVSVSPANGNAATLFSGGILENTAAMVFDASGRLIVGQLDPRVVVVDGGVLSLYREFPGERASVLTLDSSSNIYIGLRDSGTIYKGPVGTPAAAAVLATLPLNGAELFTLVYSGVGPQAGYLYASFSTGQIYRIDPSTGAFSLYGEGFGGAEEILFDSTGKMYISDASVADVVYVLQRKSPTSDPDPSTASVPEPSTLVIALAGLAALAGRRRHA